jgi:hypothetical protein
MEPQVKHLLLCSLDSQRNSKLVTRNSQHTTHNTQHTTLGISNPQPSILLFPVGFNAIFFVTL